jgi:hypothetical protein
MKLLTDNQAARVYGAMCVLNDVNAIVDVQIRESEDTYKRVFELGTDGSICVYANGVYESHESQDAFAKFYSIVN